MRIDLSKLADESRVLFSIPLKPVQGSRFQPTGFPGLGAATYQTEEGESLLVESAQSMANRLEETIWDEARKAPIEDVEGISYITVERNGEFLTNSLVESHRINSPYILERKDKTFFNTLKEELGGLEKGPVDRRMLAQTLLKFDVGSLIHGAFLAKKELAGGRLRIARSLSAFVEADGVRIAASGGVKNDHVDPQGDTKKGFGNVPFARDEYTARDITLYVNLDLAQIRGYALEENATRMLILLALYKVRALVDSDMRFRTACDLTLAEEGPVKATNISDFSLPTMGELRADLKNAIAACRYMMEQSTVTYDEL